jgi:hypothetical protein
LVLITPNHITFSSLFALIIRAKSSPLSSCTSSCIDASKADSFVAAAVLSGDTS